MCDQDIGLLQEHSSKDSRVRRGDRSVAENLVQDGPSQGAREAFEEQSDITGQHTRPRHARPHLVWLEASTAQLMGSPGIKPLREAAALLRTAGEDGDGQQLLEEGHVGPIARDPVDNLPGRGQLPTREGGDEVVECVIQMRHRRPACQCAWPRVSAVNGGGSRWRAGR